MFALEGSKMYNRDKFFDGKSSKKGQKKPKKTSVFGSSQKCGKRRLKCQSMCIYSEAEKPTETEV